MSCTPSSARSWLCIVDSTSVPTVRIGSWALATFSEWIKLANRYFRPLLPPAPFPWSAYSARSSSSARRRSRLCGIMVRSDRSLSLAASSGGQRKAICAWSVLRGTNIIL